MFRSRLFGLSYYSMLITLVVALAAAGCIWVWLWNDQKENQIEQQMEQAIIKVE